MWSLCTWCSPIPSNQADKTQENNIWHLYSPKCSISEAELVFPPLITSMLQINPPQTPNFAFAHKQLKFHQWDRAGFFNCGCYYFTVSGINISSTSALWTPQGNYSMTKLAQTVTTCSLKTGITRLKKSGKTEKFSCHKLRPPHLSKKEEPLGSSAFLQPRADKAAGSWCWLTMS